jgi:acyl CoA:acetate/3-ketoacid CoA transferase beta subunit
VIPDSLGERQPGEVAPNVTADNVQASTEPALTLADDVREIEL